MSQRKETIYVCDNPNCQARVMTEEPNDENSLAQGWHISDITIISESGGIGTKDIYACSEECVVPAMWARIQEDA